MDTDGVFSLTAHRAGADLVLAFSGELDLSAYQQLYPDVLVALSGHSGGLVVDLGAVTFLDASGIKLLLLVHRQAARTGVRPQLVRGSPRVTRVMRLVRLEQTYDVIEAARPAEPTTAAR